MTDSGSAEDQVKSISSLEEDLASLVRVRNRLSQTSDASLPKVLAGLLPRLLQRLEKNSLAMAIDVKPSEKEASIRNQLRVHLVGTTSHALERVRGNNDIPPLPWLPSVINFFSAESHIVRTLALSFVQAALTRCSLAVILSLEDTGDSILAGLFRLIDCLYHKLSVYSERSDVTLRQSIWTELCTASWLCFDAIAILCGIQPLVDWDMQNYESADGSAASPSLKVLLEKSQKPVVSERAILALSNDGAGVFSLILDLLFFSPRLLRENLEPNNGISEVGIELMCHRMKGKASFDVATENYLKCLQLLCFRYVLSASKPLTLFGAEKNSSRALILAVLFSSSPSKVGLLAKEHLNSPDVYAAGEDFPCSLTLASTLLIMVLGDKEARSVFQQYDRQRTVWEGTLGSRPIPESALTRLPLPSNSSARVLKYIADNISISSTLELDEIRLLLDLVVAIRVKTELRKEEFWAICLLYKVYLQLKCSGLQQDQDWLKGYYRKCLEAALDTLSAVSDRNKDINNFGSGGEIEREINPQVDDQRARSLRRNMYLNQMMVKHRSSLRRKRLQRDDAIEMIESAYHLVHELGAIYGLRALDGRDTSRISFEVPMLLFQCALQDEETMQPRIAQCLSSLLSAYKSVVVPGPSAEKDSSLLLPCLVAAACCFSPLARSVSAQWTKELLLLMDPLAAYHLCCFLVGDVDPGVSSIAKSVVDSFDKHLLESLGTAPEASFDFVDFSSDEGVERLTSTLNGSIAAISKEAEVPTSAASVLLQDYNYVGKDIITSIKRNREQVTAKCGVQARCNYGLDRVQESSRYCEICYDEFSSDNEYALPCSHPFCMECWHGFLEDKLAQGSRRILNAVCPDQDCEERVTGVDVQYVAPELVPAWKTALLKHYVERERFHRFCPGPDCSMVVIASGEETKGPFTCEGCEESFCFGCLERPHNPARCEDFDEWSKIFGSSKYWVKKNTKPCPGCNSPIEKNQGCNHITCSRCGYDFCWLCLAHLDTHLMAHTCNRYNHLDSADSDDEKRGLFFTDRFQAHDEGEFFAKKQVEENESRLQRLCDRVWLLKNDDLECLWQGSEMLLCCRRFLKYSYVLAFGIRRRQDKLEIFENHQGVLELFTERLSELCETSLEKVYMEQGEKGVFLHMRAVSFYSVSVQRYMERMATFANSIR